MDTKPTRAVQLSFWDEIQNSGEAEKSSEIVVSELKSMFSAINPDAAKLRSRLNAANESSGIVQIIEHKRAYNCEFMFSKVRIPLNKLMDYVVALEDSAMLDAEQVDNLRKFCPTEEEMELLKDYEGDKDRLGKCEKFFLELMKVPRADIKLRVYSYKLQFNEKVSDLRESFNSVNCAVEEIRNSAKLKRVMQTLVSLGSALNQRTRKGAVESRLESLLILTEKRSRNSNMTLMHYLCKFLADKQPEVLDFSNDLRSLRSASKIQMKILAEEIQTISRGLEIAKQESSNAKRDSINFWKASKTFIRSAEGEVKSLVSQFKIMAENQAVLIIYFGEDRFSYTFERIVCTLQTFIRKFHQANEEYVKLIKKENRNLKSTKAEAGDPLVEMSEGPATESSIVAASSGTASEDPVAQNAEERRVPKRPRKDLDPSSEENVIPAAVSSDAGNI